MKTRRPRRKPCRRPTGEPGKRGADQRGSACPLLALVSLLVSGAFASACSSPPPPEPAEPEPATVAPLVEEGESARARGDHDTAVASYERAFERTPWNTHIRYALAMSRADRAAQARADGKLPAAEEDLRKALELEPADLGLRHNLAVILTERAALDLDAEQGVAHRAEAEQLSPGIGAGQPERDARLERLLDLAFDLLERGQLEAGIARLERVHVEYPESAEAAQLLAQAFVRQADQLTVRGNRVAAARSLDRAVAVYAAMPGCAAPDWSGCPREEARIAHRNRIVVYLQAAERAEARGALEDAGRVGLAFPDLDTAIGPSFPD